MLLNRQRNLLTIGATLACAWALVTTALTAREVKIKTAQLSMAEDTIRAVTNFRYLTMEVVLYGEARAAHQWQRRHANVRQAMQDHHYSERAENLLLEREKANLAVLDRLFARLAATRVAGTDKSPKQDNTVVSALFLTTQDMLDDGFELTRLIRRDLDQAQQRATVSAIASLGLLVLLIGLTSVIIKRRVLKPVAALQRLTEQVIMGNLDVRLNLLAPNEIGELGRSFDSMTLQLLQSQQAMQRKSDQLAQAQVALQTFIDHTPALVVYWDSTLRNRFANSAYIEWFGQTPAQIRGRHIRDVIGPERYAELEDPLHSVLAGNSAIFERSLTLPSGEVRDALLSYIPDIEDGQVRGMYGFISDITPLKRAEAGQARALLHLQGVLAAASDFAIVQVDLGGTIRLFSAGAERMLGYCAAEVVDQHTPALFHAPAEVAQATSGSALDAFVRGAREHGSESREWTYVRKDGSTLPVNVTVTPVRGSDGQITGFLGIAKDIRGERESRQVLADARDQAEQASLAKSQFLANMSHEIRTPMTAVLGMLELLQHTALSPLQADYAGKSEAAARSLLGLLNDILDFSQVEANKLELECAPFSVDGLMRDLSVILSSLLGNKDVELIFAMDPAIAPLLVGDATRLRQVLINLASNAIKFTEQGEVTLGLRLAATGPDGDVLEFSVADTGIGIAGDKLGSIFDGFTQAEASTARRFGGSGLGLTISQRLVRLMGGELAVTSTKGAGSRFAFALRFGHAGPGQPGSGGGGGAGAPLRVLVVDDNPSSRVSLTAMVASFGWHGFGAASGAEALALITAAALPFDAVLADWRMPHMDGWELARHIRAGSSTTPIIVMVTAHGRSALAGRLQGERSLLNGFLTKPVTPAMLREAIRNAEAGGSIEMVQSAQPVSATRLAGLRLLVVEDNPINQQIARELLAREGAMVDVAGGGALALGMAASTTYDAILMDIQMPDMDGYACTRALRATSACHSTPIIAMTANVMSSDREACLAAGMDDHMGKPIAIDSMVKVILAQCRRAPAPLRTQPLRADAGALDVTSALERLGGNAELYVALAHTYQAEAAQFMPALRAAFGLPHVDEAANVLHTFKSAAAIIGATALQNAAGNLESRLRGTGPGVDTDAALDNLEQLVAGSLEALAHAVAAMPATLPVAPKSPAAPLAALLRALDGLLEARDMGALDALAEIEAAYGASLGAALAPLSERIAVLDFASAGSACRKMLASLV